MKLNVDPFDIDWSRALRGKWKIMLLRTSVEDTDPDFVLLSSIVGKEMEFEVRRGGFGEIIAREAISLEINEAAYIRSALIEFDSNKRMLLSAGSGSGELLLSSYVVPPGTTLTIDRLAFSFAST